MKAEIVAVGTELLIGQIPNTNAQHISERLGEIGVDVMFHTVVGDNEARIVETLKLACERVDAVIITGGLGPTHDDLTREALASLTGRALERRPDLEKTLRERFERLGRKMADANLRQAEVPEGGVSIPNPHGTAPGLEVEHEGTILFAVPGVPAEMSAMLEDSVIPRLSSLAGGSILVSRTLKVVGMGESDLAAEIDHIIRRLDDAPGPTIALLAAPGEVRIRLSVKGADREACLSQVAPVEEELRAVLGSRIFGTDDDTLEGVVAALMQERGLTLATAESFTGGHLLSRIVDVTGISETLVAGYVTYSNDAKVRDLDVPAETIAAFGAVSDETAIAMAEGARSRGGADVGLSTTGEAGPKPAEKPVGTMSIALAWEGGSTVRNLRAPGQRHQVRRWGTTAALNLLRLWLLEENPPKG